MFNKFTGMVALVVMLLALGAYVGWNLKPVEVRYTPKVITEYDTTTVVLAAEPDTVYKTVRPKTVTLRDTIFYDSTNANIIVAERDTLVQDTSYVSEQKFQFPYAVNMVKAIGKRPAEVLESSLTMDWPKVEAEIVLPRVEQAKRSGFRKGLITGCLIGGLGAAGVAWAVN